MSDQDKTPACAAYPAHEKVKDWLSGAAFDKVHKAMNVSAVSKKPGRVGKRIGKILPAFFSEPKVVSWDKQKKVVFTAARSLGDTTDVLLEAEGIEGLSGPAHFQTDLYFRWNGEVTEGNATVVSGVTDGALADLAALGREDEEADVAMRTVLTLARILQAGLKDLDLDPAGTYRIVMPNRDDAMVAILAPIERTEFGETVVGQVVVVTAFIPASEIPDADRPDLDAFRSALSRDGYPGPEAFAEIVRISGELPARSTWKVGIFLMKIVTIGAGYVGLVSGVCLSEIGHDVVCVDISAERIASLKSGVPPIYEPGLDTLMAQNVAAGRLSFSTDLCTEVADADAVFICVGTPQDPGSGRADLSHVLAAARQIAPRLAPDAVVVTKSTVPVGTNARVLAELRSLCPDREFHVASNPEFLREGSALGDFMEPDRIVVGAEDPVSERVMRAIYAPFSEAGYRVMVTDLASAEIIKYASNAFLATKIAFVNEVARLCEKTGADVSAVSEGMGSDSRIGPKFLQAGPGFGGSCFPKDTSAFAAMGRDVGAHMEITEAVMASNAARKAEMSSKIVEACGGDVEGRTIAVFGVTFKAETDDMREAPSLAILPELQRLGARLVIVDPQGRREAEAAFPGAEWEGDPVRAARGADAAVILTDWDLFRDMPLAAVAAGMRQACLIDLRNVFDLEAARAAGFVRYVSVGRIATS